MRIANLKLANHRDVPDLDVVVRNHLVLVGPNESGKTSILRLLDAALRGSIGALYAVIDDTSMADLSQPLTFEVEFADFTEDDKAAFPDEIEVLGDGSLRLRLLLRASADPVSGGVAIERMFLKPGAQLTVTRADLENLRWAYLPANRSPDRELGVSRSSAIRNLLGAVDLGDSVVDIVSAIEALHAAVHDAPALEALRESLAAALGDLLPYEVTSEDVSLALPRADETDPLADVEVKLSSEGVVRSLRDQSDGMRAMSTVAIQLLARRTAHILAVDEPEIHLHPRAQARMGALLASNAGQAVVATHSPAVLTQFSPMHAVALVGGSSRQLPSEPFADDPKAAEHWWTSPALEPLTSRAVILVEGVADRVVVEGVARALSIDLDRLGIVVATVNGAGGFRMSLRLFGKGGFGVPLVGLVDAKEASDVAKYMSVPVANVPAAGFVICDPDLEGECVNALGAEAHAGLLVASGLFKEAGICSANAVSALSDLTDVDHAAWCRKNKTEVAVALVSALTPTQASKITPISALISLAVAKIS